jgi:alpha-tubulin suppressor-like RCC1 family protein
MVSDLRTTIRLRRLLLACLASAGLAACHDGPLQPPEAGAAAELVLNASVAGTAAQTLVVTVTAADIPAELVFNLPAREGVATGTLRVPPGAARRFAVRAFDAAGEVTHTGEATAEVRAGTNPPLVMVLAARAGQVPIEVTLGGASVAVTRGGEGDLRVGATERLIATVRDAAGAVIPAPVQWATSDPSVADIDDGGLVTALRPGHVTLTAEHDGVYGRVTLEVAEGSGTGPSATVTLVAGRNHTCEILEGGSARCWGAAVDPQRRHQVHGNSYLPIPVPGNRTWSTLAGGTDFTCGLDPDGAAFCWGANGRGQLGDGTRADRTSPVAVAGGHRFRSIHAAPFGDARYACGIATDGRTLCWGANPNAQLGDGTTADRLVPTPVAFGGEFASLALGREHACGLTAAGELWCWGRYGGGMPPWTPESPMALQPVRVFADPEWVQLAAGAHFTCAATRGGRVSCFGNNLLDQLGRSGPDLSAEMLEIRGLAARPGSLVTGWGHACALDAGGVAFCWGDNASGELGIGREAAGPGVHRVTGGLTFARLAAGENHTCGEDTDGALWCWGRNESGQGGFNWGYTFAMRPTEAEGR